MKGLLKLTLLFSLLAMTVACSDDDEPQKDPLHGSWIIDSYTFVNLPDNFTIWEGYGLTSLYGETKYSLELQERTYKRSLTFNLIVGGDTTFTENGEWNVDGDFIELDPTGVGLGDLGISLDNNFEVATSSETDLILNAEISDFLYPDTTTEAYYNYVWSLNDSTSASYDTVLFVEKINELYQQVIFDLEYDFDLLN